MTTETTIYDGEMGKIVAVPAQKLVDAWDFQGEYLGGFANPDRALQAMNEAYALHHRLVTDYNNRSKR